MAILISDDGQVQNWLDDNGQQIQVASQFAPPGIAPPDPLAGVGTPIAPPPAAIAPVEVPAAQPDPALAGPGAAIQPPPGPPAPGPAEVAPAPAPAIPAAPVAPAPTEEQVLEMPLNEADVFASPSILPTGPLDKPTQVADAINETAQARADSARRVGQEQVAAGQEIVNSGLDADIRIQEYEKQRAAELQQRQADEAVLGEKHQKLVDRYANFKVDPNRGMSSDRQAMAWIGAALAGLGQVIASKDPSQNPVIPLIFAQMDRRVQLQMAERDALGVSIGQSKEGLADFRGVTKTRLGEYDLRMGAELERHAKLVDRVKVRLGSIEQQEAATQLAQTLRSEAVARTGSATKAEADQRAAERRAKAAAMAAAAERQRKEEVELAKQGLRRDPATGAIVRDPSLADPKDALSAQKLQNEIANTDPVSQRGVGGLVMKGPDGKDVAFTARDTTRAAELSTLKAATDTYSQFTQELELLIAKHGWSSDTARSPEWQQMRSKYGSALLEWKEAAKLGVLNGPDLELGEKIMGGDPTGIRDPSPALRSARSAMVDKLNYQLQANTPHGHKLARYEPPKLVALTELERPKEDDLRIATQPPASFAKTPEQRAELLVERGLAIENLRNKGVTLDEVKQIHAALQRDQANGVLSAGDVAQLSAKAMFILKESQTDKGTGINPAFEKAGRDDLTGWKATLRGEGK